MGMRCSRNRERYKIDEDQKQLKERESVTKERDRDILEATIRVSCCADVCNRRVTCVSQVASSRCAKSEKSPHPRKCDGHNTEVVAPPPAKR